MGLRKLGVGAADGAREPALELGFEGWPRRRPGPLISRLFVTLPLWDLGGQAYPAPKDAISSSLLCLWLRPLPTSMEARSVPLKGGGRCWGDPLPSQPKALWGICPAPTEPPRSWSGERAILCKAHPLCSQGPLGSSQIQDLAGRVGLSTVFVAPSNLGYYN